MSAEEGRSIVEPGRPTESALEAAARGRTSRASVEPPWTTEAGASEEVRGGRLLRAIEPVILWVDRVIGRTVPDALNPLLHTGAIAVTSLLVATATGVLLLLWYRPSVHLAYESVAAMSAAPWTAGLVRSLHRYSSDACMFFALVHALRVFVERRFAGARWLAWVTGFAMVGILWLVGWTGYWLVWDMRAKHLAVGTAHVLDAVPIFADPMARSFLTEASVNSLLFFVVFFVHMLIPLAIGIALWLHVTRLARPRFLTRAPMTLWTVGMLLLLSVAMPATSTDPARMTDLGRAFTMDWWYLAPIALTDRLGGAALWSVWALGGALGLAVPWMLGRARPGPASVDARRCNACMKCYEDCPYLAISMVPRKDENPRFELQASVDPSRCVGCGICAGSCDTAGVGVDWFAVGDQRWRFAFWLKEAADAGDPTRVAFVCTESAGASLTVDSQTGLSPDLPGYRVLRIPCGGWLHPFGVEHTLRYGGRAVLVVTCPPAECRHREGAEWERRRLEGEREPKLRSEKVPPDRLLLLSLDRTQRGELIRRAAAFRDGRPLPPVPPPGRNVAGLGATVLAAVFAGVLGVASDLGYAAPALEGSELVVTFKHPGRVSENCRELSEEEKAARPAHMRRDRICDRARSDVRLRVTVDGEPMLERAFSPTGLWNDGTSVALESLPLAVGDHRIGVEIGDGPDPDEWNFAESWTLEFTRDARRVITFDRVAGFVVH